MTWANLTVWKGGFRDLKISVMRLVWMKEGLNPLSAFPESKDVQRLSEALRRRRR